MQKFTFEYTYNDPKFGFNNQVTVEAANIAQALSKAKNEVFKTYGFVKNFTFKQITKNQ